MKTIFALFLLTPVFLLAASPSRVETGHFTSDILVENLIGIDPDRSISVYLPPGYDESGAEYPVIYYLHNFYWSNQQMFADGVVKATFDRAITNGVIRPVVVVAPDYTTPTAGAFYTNSPVSGRMQDYTIDEVVPWVQERYRVRDDPAGRGIAGEMIGGYGAFRLAMLRPDVFGSVYGLHIVATGTGFSPMADRFDWSVVHEAESYNALDGIPFAAIFVSMAQAFTPNPDRPPLYANWMKERNADGELVVDHVLARELREAFLLDRMVGDYVDNLRSLRGIKLDWGRYDPNPDHILSNRQFVRLLEEYGIEHEAEEYRGATWDQNWTEFGRVYADLLPFFDRHLAFE